MKKIFILGAIFLLFVSSSKVNANESCSIIFDVDKNFLPGAVPVPTNETSRTQQATLEAINAIAQGATGTPPTWDGACYDTGLVGLLWFTFCQNGDAMVHAGGPIHFTWDVVCGLDADNDGIVDSYDNCPDIAQPNQKDEDGDTVGDICDDDTIYGNISGLVSFGVSIEIYKSSCGTNEPDIVVTDGNGYYALGDLANGTYMIVPIIPEGADYIFNPNFHKKITVSQAVSQSYDFTATEIP
jgi:hypothetical protein